MSNINCGIGVLHVKRQILTYFFVTSFLCWLKFLLFQLIGHSKRCLQKNITNFLWLSFCDMTIFKKQCTVPVTLTFDLSKSIFFSELITTLLVSCLNFRSISLLIAEK